MAVVHFDIGRDLVDPNAIIATEFFEDAAARARQESLSQVVAVMSLLPNALAGPPEAAVYEIASATSAM